MSNARAEALAEKNAYKSAVRKRRCRIPADGFYEWQKTGPAAGAAKGKGKAPKQPYFISRPDGEPYAFAGLWEVWRGPDKDQEPLRSCTIITTSPNDVMAKIQDRSEEHTSELQSLMSISYAVFCLKKTKTNTQ